MVEFFLPYKFPSLNDYIRVERIHRQAAAKMKKDWTEQVVNDIKRLKLKPVKGQVEISFEWFEQNQRRDPDNIIFAKKFILDGMVTAGLLQNDSQKYILQFYDSWSVRPSKPGVHVSIAEFEDA